MTLSKEDQKFEQVAQKINPQSKLIRVWKLEGGVSAQVMAFEYERLDDQMQKRILRRHEAMNLKHNPSVLANEFKLLQLLYSTELTTPVPYYFDQSNEIFSTPYIVIEYIEGRSEFILSRVQDLLLQMAVHLFKIHTIDDSKLDLSFLPRQEKFYTEMLRERAAHVDESMNEGAIRDVLEAVWPFPRINKFVLLHGDFWPGNILWRDGQLAAIIDWEDAQIGDPLADVASSRLEVLWAFGIDAMQRFTQQYQVMANIDFSYLPYWDLCAALRPIARIATWGLDENIEKTMREKHRWFVDQAFEKLHSGRA